MRKSIITILAAAAVALPAVSVSAAAPIESEEVTITVSTADLDLTSPAGTEALDKRIDRALDRVCTKPDVRSIKAMAAWEVCQSEARDSAMEQLSLANPFDQFALVSVF